MQVLLIDNDKRLTLIERKGQVTVQFHSNDMDRLNTLPVSDPKLLMAVYVCLVHFRTESTPDQAAGLLSLLGVRPAKSE